MEHALRCWSWAGTGVGMRRPLRAPGFANGVDEDSKSSAQRP